jgi:hypothetical protein
MRRTVTVSLGLLLLAGCGSTAAPKGTVKGTITYKGQPVNGCALVLYPTADDANSTLIPVNQEGAFEVSDVPAGAYKVVVQPAETNAGMPSTKGLSPQKAAEAEAKMGALKVNPTIPIPDKYQDRLKTDLTCTIVKGDQTLKLELKD